MISVPVRITPCASCGGAVDQFMAALVVMEMADRLLSRDPGMLCMPCAWLHLDSLCSGNKITKDDMLIECKVILRNIFILTYNHSSERPN